MEEEQRDVRVGALAAAMFWLLAGAILIFYAFSERNQIELFLGVALVLLIVVNAIASDEWRPGDREGLRRVLADFPLWLCALLVAVIIVGTFAGMFWALYRMLIDPTGRWFVIVPGAIAVIAVIAAWLESRFGA